MKSRIPVLLILLFVPLTGCGEQPVVEQMAPQPGTLISVNVDKAPALDAENPDPVWNDAPELNVKLANGDNFQEGRTSMALKSVYHDDEIYFMVRWTDPSESLDRTPIIKQNDGTWQKAPVSEKYEDKLGLLWNINDSIKDFDINGCAVLCHPGEAVPEGGDLGKMYAANPGEVGDLWQWMVARTDSLDLSPVIHEYVDDQAIDWARYDFNVREGGAGRHPDPGEEPFIANRTAANVPVYQWKNRPSNPRAQNFLLDDNLADFVDSDWQAGDKIPIFHLRNPTGDRADILADSDYADGMWTLVFKRKLVTPSTATPPVDIQFSDLDRTYYFGVAAFDNSIKHAYASEGLMLKFRQ